GEDGVALLRGQPPQLGRSPDSRRLLRIDRWHSSLQRRFGLCLDDTFRAKRLSISRLPFVSWRIPGESRTRPISHPYGPTSPYQQRLRSRQRRAGLPWPAVFVPLEEQAMNRAIRMAVAGVVALSLPWGATFGEHEKDSGKASLHSPSQIEWKDGPPSLPKGAK